MRFKRKINYQDLGITLVALVVTIVVLLILAGISISLITGENGLIQRTIGAKDAHDIAKIKEELQLAIHALEVDYHTGNEQGTFRDYIFSTAQGKGQEKLKAELGESNLSFDSPSHKITYKGVVFNVLGNGDIIIDGNGQGGTGQTDWDEIMRTAQKHPDQRDSEDIGIDAFGNPVNLDLWVYSGTALEDANSDGSYGYKAYKPLWNSQGNEIYDIVAPSYVKYAGSNSFTTISIWKDINEFQTERIRSIVLPRELESSFESAFSHNRQLESIVLPITMTKIDDYSFSECESLKNINIPDSVIEIGEGAFSWCESLASLSIPASVTNVGDYAFRNCPGLRTITFGNPNVIIGWKAFEGSSQVCPHNYSDDGNYAGQCIWCEHICINHNWNNGVCTICGAECKHEWNNGQCVICRLECSHVWNDGYCENCDMECNHNWNNGHCTICGKNCDHYWSCYGYCEECQMPCNHSWGNDGYCEICDLRCDHNWNNGHCTICGMNCDHYWSCYGYCEECQMPCNHSWRNDGYCDICGYYDESHDNGN